MVDGKEVTRLSPLIEEAAAVGGDDDLDRLLRTLVVEARTATGARYAALGVLGDHGVLSEFIYEGITPGEARSIGAPPSGRGVLGTLIKERKALLLESIGDHPDSVGFPDNHPEMTTFLGVPITVGSESFGNLYLTEKVGGFTEDDLAAAQALSHIAGAAIQTARLQRRLRQVAIVEDRQRIARDLHDSVIQDLFAVGLGLQGLAVGANEDIAAGLNSAIDTLDDSVAALRRYIFELRESPTPPVELDQRMQEMVARMASVYPTRVVLTVDSVHNGPWLDDAVLLTTEALSNALRHARADEVEILLRVEAGQQVISITDNGTGFDRDHVHRGMGLQSIRARAAAVGGSAEVITVPGEGTRVEARFPIRPGDSLA